MTTWLSFICILLCSSLSFAAEPTGWWAVSPEQVAGAPCKNRRPPTDAEMLNFLQPSSLNKKSETLFGISFKDEDPELLQLFRDLHSYDISMKGAQPLVLKSNCNKVLCSVQAIYGSRVGVQILFMLKRYGFNGSHLRTAKASLWRSDELDDVLTALSDYPIELYPLDYNRKLVHVKRGDRMKLPVGESVANSTMEIYDMWNELSQAERQQTLLHELGHVVARKDNVDESAPWLKVAGWQMRTRTGKNGSPVVDFVLIDSSKAVSSYGKTNPREDFAESVTAYRFGGALMKSYHAEKYDFLKQRVFDGKEYLSSQTCLTSKSRTEVKKEANDVAYATALAKARKNANNLDSKFIGQAQEICLETLVKVMMGEAGTASNCTSRALQRLQLEKYGKRKLDGSLLSDQQLNAISFKGDTEVDFSKRVRTKFSTEASKSLNSDFRDSMNRTSCSSWAKDAQMLFTATPMLSKLAGGDRMYFYKNQRREGMTAFFERSCQAVRQNAGRLDLGILQNLP